MGQKEKEFAVESFKDIADTLQTLREQVLTLASCFELDEDVEEG